MTNVDKSYTISEVAEKLNLAPKTLRRWEEAGKFQASRTVGGQRRYSIEDLQVLDAIKHGTIPNSNDLLSIEQAANLFGVTPQTLQKWEDQGKIHPFITAGNTYYPKSRLIPKIQELKSFYEEEIQPEEIPTQESLIQPSPTQSIPRAHYTQSHTQEPTISQPRAQLDLRKKLKPLAIKQPPLPNLPREITKITTRSANSQKILLTASLINFLITVGLLGGYHALTSQETQSPLGQVQGVSEQQSPLDRTLQSILDITGNLNTPGSITTKDSLSIGKAINFSPSSVSNPTPGTMYYDASTQTLKLYTRGAWYDFPSQQEIPLPDNSLLKSGLATLKKGQKEVNITDSDIALDSHITITFQDDYSPAKKYWLNQSSGSFTLETDFPVGQSADFTYLVLTPQDEESEATASGNTQ